MKKYIRTIAQLIAYLLIGIIPLIPAAMYYFLQGNKALKYLLRVDLLVCVGAHGIYRTISGLTGERALTSRRYRVQEMIIDVLAYPFEKEWNHCKRANKYEQERFKNKGYYVSLINI